MKKIFVVSFCILFSSLVFTQIPELGISKNFADTCTINFAKPDSGQFIRMYPLNFSDTAKNSNIILRPEFYDTLTLIITSLPNCIFELSSHSDSKGPDAQNLATTKKRAQSMMLFLIQKCGLKKKNLIARGYGDKRLLNSCDDGVECTPEQHARNRRIELKIVGFTE